MHDTYFPNPQPDLFEIFVDHFISKYYNTNINMTKFINIRFNYSSSDDVLSDFLGESSVYVMMNHMENLVHRLCGLSANLNMISSNTTEQLRKAIHNAQAYISADPRWFSKRWHQDTATEL